MLAISSSALQQHTAFAQLANQQPTERLLETGSTYYQTGRYSEAARIWQQAAIAYQEHKNKLKHATSLNYLAIAYQELGQWENARSAIASSLNLLEKQQDSRGQAILAQALNNRGHIEMATGQLDRAYETWKQAEVIYEHAGNQMGKLGSQINQAIALQALGMHRQAKVTLEQVDRQLQDKPLSQLKANGLLNLGRALQKVGDLPSAQKILEQSLAISQQIGATEERSTTLINLGNIARHLQQNDKALVYYREATGTANNNLVRVQAQLNELSLLIKNQQWLPACSLLPEIQSNLPLLSASRPSIYATVNLANSLMKIKAAPTSYGASCDLLPSSKIAQLLAIAIQQAGEIRDTKAEAFTLKQLGRLYEENQQLQEARRLTEQALLIAEGINAEDIAAIAFGQLGRLFKQMGDKDRAIAAYTKAFKLLESLRGNLVATNSNIRFDFRDNVEPVYRELVSLLLLPDGDKPVSQENLQKAREVIEALQLAEIENFLRESCLEARPEQIDQIDPTTAVIYPIILSDRLEVIVSISGRLQHHAVNLPKEEIERDLKELYSSFAFGYPIEKHLKIAYQIYNWLIQPLEAQLTDNNIKTLVFVPDGFLRSLPMGALYDSQHYLLEKYNIASSPGLQLLPGQLTEINNREIEILMAGLSEGREGFKALPGVTQELYKLKQTLPSALFLIDEQFTKSTFTQQVSTKPLDLIHIATHGQFSSIPEETFILTYDGKINIKELANLLEQHRFANKPVELLVLSACQTAKGDDHAVLGLAGLAVRSNAASTVGTLWTVNDISTAHLMIDFYQQLTQPNTTKAEALRRAQLNLLKDNKYSPPYFWAPFVLIGNWI